MQESIKVSFKCPVSYKAEFKNSHCLLIISVGQKVHEGEIFRATVQLINKAFRECTILVADSLQRHTLAIDSDITKEFLYQQSMEEGDLWLKRNKKNYDELTIPYKVMRWNGWLEHKNYLQQREMINSFYESNKEITRHFYAAVDKFLTLYQQKKGEKLVDYSTAFNFSLEYLKEECAVMCLWCQAGYNFEVYPSGRNRAMLATYKYLIEQKFFNILPSVSLYIKRLNRVFA